MKNMTSTLVRAWSTRPVMLRKAVVALGITLGIMLLVLGQRTGPPQKLYLRGVEALNNRQEKTALRLFLRAHESDPANTGYAWQVARLYASQEQYEQALAYYRKLEELLPSNASVAVEQGQMEQILGNKKRASTLYKRASELDPLSPKPYALLGEIALDEGDRMAALLYFQKALDLHPDNERLEYLVAKLKDNRQRQHARP